MKGYYVATAGKNAKKIQEYIQKQLEEDKTGEAIDSGEFLKSLFTSSKKKTFRKCQTILT